MKKIKPYHDRILVKPLDPDKFVGGLELLSSEIEDKNEGIVIAVGTGVPLHEINLKVDGELSLQSMLAVKQVVELIENGRKLLSRPGDHVIFGKHAGTKQMHLGEQCVILREADIFGKYEDE